MNKKLLVVLPLLFGGMITAQQAKNQKTSSAISPVNELTEDQKASYYFGLNLAKNMKAQGFNVDVDLLSLAMREEFQGKPKLLPESELNSFLESYTKKMNEKKVQEQKVLAEANKKKGLAFLEQNKKNPKIKTTASGLQYEVLKTGDGKTHPKATDLVNVTYEGKLIDGTVFDSTEKKGGQPIDIPLNGVIKGWTEGIQLMTKGAKYRFYIPSDLGFGESGAGNVIPPGSALIFDVELFDFKNNQQEPIPAPVAPVDTK